MLTDILDLGNILSDLVEIFSLELFIFLENGILLDVPEHEGRYLLEIECLIRSKREQLIGLVVVHDNEHLGVAVSDQLLGFPEQASLLHVELLVLFIRLFVLLPKILLG